MIGYTHTQTHTMEVIVDSDSSEVEEIDLVSYLRERISSLEEENKLLKRSKAQGEKTHLSEIGTLQEKVIGAYFLFCIVSIF